MWGSGRVTKGNVPGLVVTVLSKRIRFIVRVKSSCSSLERASEQLSRLEGGGGERGGNEKRRGRRRKERERRKEGRWKAEDGDERKEPISITFLLDNVTIWPAMCHAPPSLPPLPSLPRGLYLVSFSRGEDLAVVSILSSSSFPNSPIPSTGIQST